MPSVPGGMAVCRRLPARIRGSMLEHLRIYEEHYLFRDICQMVSRTFKLAEYPGKPHSESDCIRMGRRIIHKDPG